MVDYCCALYDRRRRGYNSGGGGDDAPGSAAGDAREMKQSLQRTRKMMAEQLARVAQVSEVMGEQDALLMNTFAEHQASFSCSDQGTVAGRITALFFELRFAGGIIASVVGGCSYGVVVVSSSTT